MSALRRNLMLGTAGHVDHGKTALVRLLTGCETDTMAEEKQRGLTIDLGYAPCRLADQRVVGVVDVPGHTDFIRNMVAGAHGIDVVILVVAADDGIMPQTIEHLQILTLMGLQSGVVALTKIDLVEPARLHELTQNLQQLLAGTFLRQAPVCPLSNLTGQGFDRFFAALNDVVNRCPNRPVSGRFRTWVQDAFSIRGAGTIVTGIPMSGRVRVSDRLVLHPTQTDARVRQLQVYGEDAQEGLAGECVALNLPELDHRVVRRGMILFDANDLAPVQMAEAELQLLATLASPLDDNTEVQVHVGTASVTARIASLQGPRMIAGQHQMVQLRLAHGVPLLPGDRYVIRGSTPHAAHRGLTTLGGGIVLGISNTRLRRQKPWTLSALTARREAIASPKHWCELRVQEFRGPATLEALSREGLLQRQELVQLLTELQTEGRVLQTPSGAWVTTHAVEKAASALENHLQTFHAAHPDVEGADDLTLLRAVPMTPDLFAAAKATLIRARRLEQRRELLALAGWQPQVGDADQQIGETLERALRQAGWTPPSLEALAASAGATPERVSAAARLLAARGAIVQLDQQLWMHRDAIAAGEQVALHLFRAAASFSTMQFRDALQVSRKYAVPLLDHLDKTRFTVRSGHQRTPGIEARKRLATQAPAGSLRTSHIPDNEHSR